MPVHVVDHPHNQGLDAALKSSRLKANSLARPEDVIVIMDLIIPIHRSRFRLWWKSSVMIRANRCRYAETGNEIRLSFHRRLLSRGGSKGLRLLPRFRREGHRPSVSTGC